MSCFVRYASQNHQRLSTMFRAFGLEWPKKPYFFKDGETIRFSGWIIAEPDDNVTFMVWKNDEVVGSHILNTERPDVARAYNVSPTHSIYGFNFQLAAGEFTRIEISTKKGAYDIWHAEYFKGMDNPAFLGVRNRWLDLHDGTMDLSIEAAVAKYDGALVEEFISEFLIVSDVAQAVARINDLDGESTVSFDSLNTFICDLRNPYWSIDAIEQASMSKELTVQSIFGNVKAVCSGSFIVRDFNYLAFRDGAHMFYVVQYCGSVSVIFPTYFLVLGISVAEWVIASRSNLRGVFDILSNSEKYANKKNHLALQAKFVGLNVSQSRPYHYFYDYLYGMHILKSRMREIPDTYSVSGFDFVDISKAFGTNAIWHTYSSDDLNTHLAQEQGFIISPCVQFCQTNDKKMLGEMCERLVENFAYATKSVDENNSKADDVTSHFPIVWIGVSTEKRSWLEQVDGYSSIINKLKETYPNICILVDGRTFPINPLQADYSHKQREDEICRVLMENCSGIKFVSLIGLTAAEKIFFAQKCNLFVSSYATDSMYPSCVCRKAGVVYAPQALGAARGLHVHHDILEVPQGYVKDIGENSNNNPYAVSVSIDWQVIYELIVQVIEQKLTDRQDVVAQERCNYAYTRLHS